MLTRSLEPGRPELTPVDHRMPLAVASAIELFDQDLRRHWTIEELSSRLSTSGWEGRQ